MLIGADVDRCVGDVSGVSECLSGLDVGDCVNGSATGLVGSNASFSASGASTYLDDQISALVSSLVSWGSDLSIAVEQARLVDGGIGDELLEAVNSLPGGTDTEFSRKLAERLGGK